MHSSLVRLVPTPGICTLPSCDWCRRRVYALFPRVIGAGAGYMLSSLVRLVPTPGICSLPSCDWCRRRVYALFPRAIGADAGYMLSSLVRLVPTAALRDISMPGSDSLAPQSFVQQQL
eukprot:1182731-Prorocentrum_minimum.AAC.1